MLNTCGIQAGNALTYSPQIIRFSESRAPGSVCHTKRHIPAETNAAVSTPAGCFSDEAAAPQHAGKDTSLLSGSWLLLLIVDTERSVKGNPESQTCPKIIGPLLLVVKIIDLEILRID